MSRVFAELLLQQKKHCALAVKDARQQRDVEEWRRSVAAEKDATDWARQDQRECVICYGDYPCRVCSVSGRSTTLLLSALFG